ncbi:hypothetical protein RUM44_005040 [Polyplax serrata]|uniref:Tetraspanin n=1 Tax=Polyplax serrata TaxID=468196 RepID=A0ABR1AWR6_POLSC
MDPMFKFAFEFTHMLFTFSNVSRSMIWMLTLEISASSTWNLQIIVLGIMWRLVHIIVESGVNIIYTFLLVFIFLLEAMVGTLAYIYEEQVESELKLNLNSTFLDNYKVDTDKTKAIDDMQLQFKCCGAVRFEDWRHSKWFQQSRKTSNNLVPDSCCKTPSLNCGIRDHPSNIQYNGCLYRLSDEVKSHLVIISSVGLGICVLQIFGVIFSFCLYIKLKSKEENKP